MAKPAASTPAHSWRTDKRTTAQRGYGGKWQRERKAFLLLHPLCCMCEAKGLILSATTVDHRIAHHGDEVLFWDKSNWQSLCTTHHNRDKQAMEKSGRVIQTIGPDGYPVEDAPPQLRAHTPGGE